VLGPGPLKNVEGEKGWSGDMGIGPKPTMGLSMGKGLLVLCCAWRAGVISVCS